MKESKYAGTQTEKNLMAAFAGESEVRNKYTYFASKAKKEGYEPVSYTHLLLCIERRQNLGLSQSQNRSANLRKHNIHIPHGRFTQKRKRKKPLDGLCY